MWTLILRAQIEDELSVTKHIHLLEKNVAGYIHSPHTVFNYDSFIDVAVVLNNESLTPTKNREQYEILLSEDELSNIEVQTLLSRLETLEGDIML